MHAIRATPKKWHVLARMGGTGRGQAKSHRIGAGWGRGQGRRQPSRHPGDQPGAACLPCLPHQKTGKHWQTWGGRMRAAAKNWRAWAGRRHARRQPGARPGAAWWPCSPLQKPHRSGARAKNRGFGGFLRIGGGAGRLWRGLGKDALYGVWPARGYGWAGGGWYIGGLGAGFGVAGVKNGAGWADRWAGAQSGVARGAIGSFALMRPAPADCTAGKVYVQFCVSN